MTFLNLTFGMSFVNLIYRKLNKGGGVEMKKILPLLLFFALSIPFISYSKDIDIGVSITNGELRSFYFSLSDYYRVPEEKIIIIKKRYPVIIEDELPILLLIVREARVEPDIIIQLREKGYSWYDIMIRFKIYPEVVFKRYIIYGPPYGKAWGHHKKKIIYDDRDIIIFSNLKFLSEYYHEDPQIILKYKEKYPRFVDVHREIYEIKKEKKLKDRDFDRNDRGRDGHKPSEFRDKADIKDKKKEKDKDKDKGRDRDYPGLGEWKEHPGKGKRFE